MRESSRTFIASLIAVSATLSASGVRSSGWLRLRTSLALMSVHSTWLSSWRFTALSMVIASSSLFESLAMRLKFR